RLLGGSPPTTGRIFNGSTDFLNSAATIDLTTYKQLSGSYDINWTTNANDDHLLAEFSANSNNCATVFRRCFAIDPNESSTTTYMIVVTSGSGSGNFTCSFTRPSAAAKHRIAWSLDISVNPNTCAVWVDGISQTT